MSQVSDEVNKVVNDFFKDKKTIIKSKAKPEVYDALNEDDDFDLENIRIIKPMQDPKLRSHADAFFKPEEVLRRSADSKPKKSLLIPQEPEESKERKRPNDRIQSRQASRRPDQE